MSTERPLKKRKTENPAEFPPALNLTQPVLQTIPELLSAQYPLALMTPMPSFRAAPDAPPPIQSVNPIRHHNLPYCIARKRLF